MLREGGAKSRSFLTVELYTYVRSEFRIVMMGAEVELGDLPPSAKLVYKVLEYGGPQTQKQIVEESMLSPRTVRYALERLDDAEVVSERVYVADARQSLYELNGTPGADSGCGGPEAGACAE